MMDICEDVVGTKRMNNNNYQTNNICKKVAYHFEDSKYYNLCLQNGDIEEVEALEREGKQWVGSKKDKLTFYLNRSFSYWQLVTFFHKVMEGGYTDFNYEIKAYENDSEISKCFFSFFFYSIVFRKVENLPVVISDLIPLYEKYRLEDIQEENNDGGTAQIRISKICDSDNYEVILSNVTSNSYIIRLNRYEVDVLLMTFDKFILQSV